MKRLKISVVITCFNFEKFVGETIESVLHQRPGGYDFELLVVDDASTDKSVEVISRYPPAKLIRAEKNQGVLLSTLQGLTAVTGEVVSFLDADDRWLPSKLSQVAAAFSADPTLTFLTHNYTYIDELGRPLHRDDSTQLKMVKASPDQHDHLLREGLLAIDGTVWLGSAFSLRVDHQAFGAFDTFCRQLPEPQFTYQDFPLAYWWLTAPDARFGYVKEPLFEYRIHSSNHSGAGASVEKMLRNIRKGLNTRRALTQIVSTRKPWLKSLPALRLREAEYEFLEAVYRHQPAQALQWWVQLSREVWPRNTALKELARMVAAGVLWPAGATRALTRVRQ